MLALLAFSKLAIAAFFLFQYTGSPTSLMEGLVVMNRNLEADPLYKRDQPFFLTLRMCCFTAQQLPVSHRRAPRDIHRCVRRILPEAEVHPVAFPLTVPSACHITSALQPTPQ